MLNILAFTYSGYLTHVFYNFFSRALLQQGFRWKNSAWPGLRVHLWRGFAFINTKCLLIKSYWCVVALFCFNSCSFTEAIALWSSSFMLESQFQLQTLGPRSQPYSLYGCDRFPQFWTWITIITHVHTALTGVLFFILGYWEFPLCFGGELHSTFTGLLIIFYSIFSSCLAAEEGWSFLVLSIAGNVKSCGSLVISVNCLKAFKIFSLFLVFWNFMM